MALFNWPSTAVQLYCTKKWFETADTLSLLLCDPAGANFSFKPGQFISLGLEIDGMLEFRAYSISSVPGQAYLQLTIKRVAGGKLSNYLIDEFKPGDKVAVMAPTGPFNSVDCPAKTKVALLSAGCGITPVMAMARSWLAQAVDVDICFIHMAKDKTQTIYYTELVDLDRECENFSLRLLLKDKQQTTHPQGRLDQSWLQHLCPDLHERSVYLCGPEPFMRDMRSYAQALGVDMEDFFAESFTPIQRGEPKDSEVSFMLSVPSFGVDTVVTKGAVLADVLEEAGVPIIIACRSGVCGSCKCQLTEGEVNQTSIETLSPDELAQGYTLACSTQIQSDVTLQLV